MNSRKSRLSLAIYTFASRKPGFKAVPHPVSDDSLTNPCTLVPLGRHFAVKMSFMLHVLQKNCLNFNCFSYHTAFFCVFVVFFLLHDAFHIHSRIPIITFFFMTQIIQTYTPAEDVPQLV